MKTHIERIELLEELVEDILDGLDESEQYVSEYYDRYEQPMKNKYDWIVVDADNNWIASWNDLTEQQAQEEIVDMRNEIPTIFKPDVNIYAYKVNKSHEPEIEIY